MENCEPVMPDDYVLIKPGDMITYITIEDKQVSNKFVLRIGKSKDGLAFFEVGHSLAGNFHYILMWDKIKLLMVHRDPRERKLEERVANLEKIVAALLASREARQEATSCEAQQECEIVSQPKSGISRNRANKHGKS